MKSDIGYLIKNVNDKIKCKADANLKRHNLTLSQSRVLSILSRCGGSLTQKEIEVQLDISHPTVVGIISRMERSGYITCSTDETDRRNKIVTLTEKAANARSEILSQIKRDEAEMLKNFSDEEIDALRQMLEIISKNIE